MNISLMNRIKHHLFVNLINEFNFENYQTLDDVNNFFERFINNYQLSANEIIILMELFKLWLVEQNYGT